jgi:O-antigen ligase/tetratricopeptide (TPR) repeat protein
MNEIKKGLNGKAGWVLALERAPQFLAVMLLFILPFLTQWQGADKLFPKWAIIQLLVLLMLSTWVLRLALTGKLIWAYSRAHLILLILIIWIALTCFLSPYPQTALLALGDGVVYPLWYLLLTFTCIELWRAENLLIVLLISGLGTGFWALGQALGIGTGPWEILVKTSFGGRAIAGMGNPDFLAGYLLMIWPLALALLLRAGMKLSRIFWSFLWMASLCALLLTGSPTGYLGFLAGALVFAFFSFKDRLKVAFPWLLVLLGFLIGSFFLRPMSGQLQELLSEKGEAFQFQEQVWTGALDIVKRNPVFGVGYGAFASAFPAHRPVWLALHPAAESHGENHAYNWILEWMAETGVIGLLLLLAFWFYVLAQWWKLYKANAIPKVLAIGFFAVVSGVAVDNLFETNSYEPFIRVPLLFLAAFPVALSQRFYRMEGFPIRLKEMDLSKFKAFLWPLAVGIAVLVCLQIGNVFKRQEADILREKAAGSTQLGKWDEALGLYSQALKWDPSNFDARYLRGSIYLDRNQKGDLEAALADFNALDPVAPDYQLLHFKKYEALSALKREDEAKIELKRAVRLDPMLIYLLDDFKKARKLTAGDHLSEALIVYQGLFLDYPTCVPMLIDYANCVALCHDYESAINLYRNVLVLDPGNIKAADDLQKVREILQRAEELKRPKASVLGSEL